MNEDERQRRAAQQRSRRISIRVCGRCGGQPAEMMDWGGRNISICPSCRHRLEDALPPESACGHCEGQPAEIMEWGGRRIAICQPCADRLLAPPPDDDTCGGCGSAPAGTLGWGGRRIPICRSCANMLRPSPPIDRSCVEEEIRHYQWLKRRNAQKPRPEPVGLWDTLRRWVGL